MTRSGRLALATLATLVLTGCAASSGPKAEDVVEELSALFPAPNARDNTGSCAGDGGCVQLVTTDAVSVYQWPDEQTAARHADWRAEVDQVGPFVLSYAGSEQQLTSAEARDLRRRDAVP